jgi:hypothetical protein
VIAGQVLSVQFSNGGGPYAIVSGLAGVTIDSTTGLLSWTPGLGDVGPANIVVSTGNSNGWGAVYATLQFPVYFTDTPTGLIVASSTDPVTNITTVRASWNPPTMNTSNIVGYQVSAVPTGSPSGAPPMIFTVPATTLSFVLSDFGILSGLIQVAAYDQFGNLGVPSMWVTF